jgi:hypothetical protein
LLTNFGSAEPYEFFFEKFAKAERRILLRHRLDRNWAQLALSTSVMHGTSHPEGAATIT